MKKAKQSKKQTKKNPTKNQMFPSLIHPASAGDPQGRMSQLLGFTVTSQNQDQWRKWKGVVWRSVSSYLTHQPVTGSRRNRWFVPRPQELLSCIKLLGGRMKIEIDRIHLTWAARNAFTGSVKFNIDDKVGWDPLPSSEQINVQVLTTGHYRTLH